MAERKTIYLCLAHMSEEGYEQKYVKEAFDTNWVVPMGPNVNAFEHELEGFVQAFLPLDWSRNKQGQIKLDLKNWAGSSLETELSLE